MTICITCVQLLLKFTCCFSESLGVEISPRNINEYDTVVSYRTIVADLGATDPAGTVIKECQWIVDPHSLVLIVFKKGVFAYHYS